MKNAAGFDLPKFFVGSLGRFGVLAELTFKVFPRPASALTLRLAAGTLDAAVKVITEAASSRFEFEALDIAPDAPGVLARLAGPPEALKAVTGGVFARWPGEILSDGEAERRWGELREFRWVGSNRALVKVVLSPGAVPALDQLVRSLDGAGMHLSAGGNVAFVSLGGAGCPPPPGALDQRLRDLGLSGVALRGDVPLWVGQRERPAITQAVKQALDPENRYPTLDD